jgi:hydrogenase maturation protein HypF
VLHGDERRRFYPFNSCSFCGPRFAVMHKLPYDRENTSWSKYPMCDKCREEYSNPCIGGVRRFFYQGISCRHDGPKIRLLRIDGREIAVEDPIVEAARLIDTGHSGGEGNGRLPHLGRCAERRRSG